MKNRSWTLSIARLKVRLAEAATLPPGLRPLLEQTLSGCDALATELAEAEQELTRMKAELAHRSAEYDHLWQQMPVACLLLDGSGRVVRANAEAASILNVSVRSLPDRLLMLFVEDRDEFQRLFTMLEFEPAAKATLVIRPRERAPVRMDVHVVCRAPGNIELCYCFMTPHNPLALASVRKALVVEPSSKDLSATR